MSRNLDNLVIQTRRDILRMVHAVNSGHPGGSLGCVEFFVTLYNKIMKHDHDNFSNDIFNLSNGHKLNALKMFFPCGKTLYFLYSLLTFFVNCIKKSLLKISINSFSQVLSIFTFNCI